jgi:hypothetical protein
MSPRWGSTPRLTDRLTVGRNVTHSLSSERHVRQLPASKDRNPEYGNRGIYIVGRHCIAIPSENVEDLVHAVVAVRA